MRASLSVGMGATGRPVLAAHILLNWRGSRPKLTAAGRFALTNSRDLINHSGSAGALGALPSGRTCADNFASAAFSNLAALRKSSSASSSQRSTTRRSDFCRVYREVVILFPVRGCTSSPIVVQLEGRTRVTWHPCRAARARFDPANSWDLTTTPTGT